VAILGKTPRACFDKFVEHLNPLVHAVLPTKVPLEAVLLDVKAHTATLGFRGAYTIPLKTKWHGKVHFRVDFYQRVGGEASPIPVTLRGTVGSLTVLQQDVSGYGKGTAFAKDAESKNIYERFNRLHGLANEVGKQLYGAEWDGETTNTLPSVIDPSTPIDHDAI
jgi:hypothetical protein